MDKERERKMFWVIHYDDLHFIEGLSCDNKDYWWFPDIGYSCCMDIHIFENTVEGKKKLIKKLEEERAKLMEICYKYQFLIDEVEEMVK